MAVHVVAGSRTGFVVGGNCATGRGKYSDLGIEYLLEVAISMVVAGVALKTAERIGDVSGMRQVSCLGFVLEGR